MYPFFIIVVVILVISVMMVVVVPKLLDIFEDKGGLPTSTKILIGVSDAFKGYWFLMIILLVAFIVFVSIWKKTPD
jgi:type IV pilus assembly protein PilC